MNRRIVRSLLLAVLLLMAQIGASAHRLSHLGDEPDSDAAGTTCAWCSAYATSLDGAAPDAPAPRLVPRQPGVSAPVEPAAPIRLRLALAYRSQAPPVRS
jgi:hypothetical protein